MERQNKELSVCVLISCMKQDKSIIERTHVQTNVVVVDQCDVENTEEWSFTNSNGNACYAKYISTKERGLSRSRNMAIKNAIGDVCLICDDDEELVDGYEDKIKNAYMKCPDADVITFAFNRDDKSYSSSFAPLNFMSILRTSSVEITFRRNVISNKDIWFDEKMGSGTGNGAGEECMFLMTCHRKKLGMYYVPSIVGRLLSTDSQWFKGFDKTYFVNLGWSSRRIMGGVRSFLYIIYFAIAHYKLCKKDISCANAIFCFFKGWMTER